MPPPVSPSAQGNPSAVAQARGQGVGGPRREPAAGVASASLLKQTQALRVALEPARCKLQQNDSELGEKLGTALNDAIATTLAAQTSTTAAQTNNSLRGETRLAMDNVVRALVRGIAGGILTDTDLGDDGLERLAEMYRGLTEQGGGVPSSSPPLAALRPAAPVAVDHFVRNGPEPPLQSADLDALRRAMKEPAKGMRRDPVALGRKVGLQSLLNGWPIY